jgi:hypothetical protein
MLLMEKHQMHSERLHHRGTRRDVIRNWSSVFSSCHRMAHDQLVPRWRWWLTNELLDNELKGDVLARAIRYAEKKLLKYPHRDLNAMGCLAELIIAIRENRRHPRFPTKRGFLAFVCGAIRSIVSHAEGKRKTREEHEQHEHAEGDMENTTVVMTSEHDSPEMRLLQHEAIKGWRAGVHHLIHLLRHDPPLQHYVQLLYFELKTSGKNGTAKQQAELLSIREGKPHTEQDIRNLERRLDRWVKNNRRNLKGGM